MTRFPKGPFLAVLLCLSADAAPLPRDPIPDAASRDRFGSYGDNYLLWHFMSDSGWVDRYEKALRAHYSIRYVLYSWEDKWWLFSYTGEFDFYWFNARSSSPVINRISNPGVHLRKPARSWIPQAGDDDYFELGFEHRSDGQVIEVTTAEGALAAQRAYDSQDRPFFDQISRGSNYFSLKTSLSEDALNLPVSAIVNAKLYSSQSSEITWGPRTGLNDKVSDYDLLTIRIIRRQPGWGQFEFQWMVGGKGLKTDSFEFGWQLPERVEGWSIPFYVQLHHGPMNTLSNYTQREDSIGVGLRFACF
jgi:outer membrane phospholipase A